MATIGSILRKIFFAFKEKLSYIKKDNTETQYPLTRMMKKYILIILILIILILINKTLVSQETPKVKYPSLTQVKIERLNSDLDNVLYKDFKIDILAEGFQWTEGPLWLEEQKMLIFSDVPANKIYKWREGIGADIYLTPSGYTGKKDTKIPEPGSNGLTLDKNGNLVICQHGDRRIVRMDASLDNPKPQYSTLVDHYKKLRLNSPNDVVYSNNGTLFFTDPPYGLPTQRDDDPLKEIPFNGVYSLNSNGELKVLTKLISKPNGIALFPDEKKILVSNSDLDSSSWYILDINDLESYPRIFYTITLQKDEEKGVPDGLKITKNGIVFATGPGGVWIFDKDARLLGKIKFEDPVSNVALSKDEKNLYLTNSSRVLRIRLK